MPSILRINGRIVSASKNYRHDPRASDAATAPYNAVASGKIKEDGSPMLACGAPIPSDSPESAYREGTPHEEDGVVYRVVNNLKIKDGWHPAPYWCELWDCEGEELKQLVLRGKLDAVIEAGTSVKRYRVRDEAAALAWLESEAEARQVRIEARKRDAEAAAFKESVELLKRPVVPPRAQPRKPGVRKF